MAHIGIDARLTHYRVGGISRYIRALISAFEQLSPPHTFTIVQSRKSRGRLSARFPGASAWTPPHHFLERAALSLELAGRRFDLLHSPDFIAPLRGGRRHVITVHDLSFIHFPEYITADSRRYYNGQIQASVRRADHILADSEATKRDLIDILAVPADKISVHMLGVDQRFTPLSRAACEPALRALDLPEEYFLFVGTLEPRKNLVGLARAYRELNLEHPDAPKLVIAGRPGWHYHQLMSDLAAVGVNGDLIIREAVADAQLPALYSRALALITPSFYEGFRLDRAGSHGLRHDANREPGCFAAGDRWRCRPADRPARYRLDRRGAGACFDGQPMAPAARTSGAAEGGALPLERYRPRRARWL